MAEIPATLVKQLREATGAGMMDCKRALAETEGDFETAKDWLRKRGQAIADKKASRKAAEGLIFSHVSDDGRVGVILELNCETDFVARNEAFVKLGNDISRQIADGGPGTEGCNVESFLQAPAAKQPAVTVAEMLRQHAATLGENIGIGGFARHQSSSPESYLQTYIHPPGKLGVLLELRYGKEDTKLEPTFKEAARDIAMHIAAAAPQFLDRCSVASDKLEREKSVYREQALNEGKSEKFVDKIVEGRVGKYYKETCLLEQEFVKNPDETITQLLQRVGKEIGDELTLVGFHRMKVGG